MAPGLPSGPSLDRVFCCRSLRFDQVELVGFDMDYTLAAYRQPEMDRLAARATLRRLVEAGYPPELEAVDCPYDFPIRGLLVDIVEGNVLKMDRYRYVKTGYHGKRLLTRAERQRYEGRRPRLGGERYRWVDTLYSLPDVAVYVAAVDLLERLGPLDHAQLWEDVRVCSDVAHRDGEIYDAVLGDIDRYVARDPDLAPMLEGLRRAGKRTFLLTNSGAGTTEALMSQLLDAPRSGGAWRELFDAVVTEAVKPVWFTGSHPFTDAEVPGRPVQSLEPGRLYRGGNQADFERMVGVGGPHVLYVGDHIYGDVLRANVESGWRTCMIIQEMAEELVADCAHAADLARIDALDTEVVDLHDLARAGATGAADLARELEAERDELEARVDGAHHPCWGALFRAGTELSMLGAQLEKYAWLYTTKPSNLGRYSPYHLFRSPRARLPHD